MNGYPVTWCKCSIIAHCRKSCEISYTAHISDMQLCPAIVFQYGITDLAKIMVWQCQFVTIMTRFRMSAVIPWFLGSVFAYMTWFGSHFALSSADDFEFSYLMGYLSFALLIESSVNWLIMPNTSIYCCNNTMFLFCVQYVPVMSPLIPEQLQFYHSLEGKTLHGIIGC